MCAAVRKFSKYFNELDGTAKKQYLEKLHSIGENIDDPYTLNWKETPAADHFMAVCRAGATGTAGTVWAVSLFKEKN